MEGYDREFWQFSDQLRLQTATSFSGLSLGDSIWSPADSARARNADPALFSPIPAAHDGPVKINGAALHGPGLIGSGKLAFGATKADRYNNNNTLPAGDAKAYGNGNNGYGAPAKPNNINNNNNNNFGLNKMLIGESYTNTNTNNNLNGGSGEVKSYFNKSIGRPASNNNNSNYGGGYGKKGAVDGKKKHAKNDNNNNHGAASEKRFKTLPASEALPRNEPIGGYIFVCNNDTMEENLKRQLFGTITILGLATVS
jgi:hypothetical protein